MPYGEHIQLFVLDSRDGYLGVTQAKWLRDELLACGSLWKIIISSVPLGMDVSKNNAEVANDVNAFVDLPESESQPQQEGKVKMVLPTPTEDVDEDGRPKSSLEYIAAYLQKYWLQEGITHSLTHLFTYSLTHSPTHSGKKKKKNDEINENNPVDDAGSTEDQSVNSIDSVISYPNDGSIVIDSGIVFITGGICSQPFVATYDPVNIGNPYYCAEIGVGAYGASSASLQPVNSMGANFLYVGNGGDIETAGFAAGVNLNEDGALNIKIARHSTASTAVNIMSNEGVEIVYDAVFRSAKMFKIVK